MISNPVIISSQQYIIRNNWQGQHNDLENGKNKMAYGTLQPGFMRNENNGLIIYDTLIWG